MNNDFVYDLETYPNVFTATFIRVNDGAVWVFEISFRKNESVALYHFLIALMNMGNVRQVGYNNVGFDYTLLHDVILTQGVIDYHRLYSKSQAIFNSEDRWEHNVRERDWFLEQIDLFKIHHFDNKARSTSLKSLEFAMRSDNIEDLPFAPGTYLTSEQIDVLIQYNIHDVTETLKFLNHSRKQIKFREELSEKYSRNFMNHNDTKIGKDYFIMELEESGVQCYGQNRKPIQTVRPQINLAEAVFPYIHFEHPAFNHVKDWLCSQVITSTKGVFEQIPVSPEMAQYMNKSLVKIHEPGKKPVSLLNYDKPTQGLKHVSGKKDASGLNCIVDGFQFDFGTGGIHGSVGKRIMYTDHEKVIIDLDVASYYPNLAIANRLYPQHLGEHFCEIYEDVYHQRKALKKAGKDTEQQMLKLALNGVYGDSNNQYSPFYDPLYTMKITINGQLLLCMLAEQCMKIPGLEMIQINTDGLTVRIPHQYVEHLNAIRKWWEDFTMLELEEARYSRMFIRDVNNYIAEYEDGKLKRKGAYAHNRDDLGELPWHKNHSGLIIAKAAEAALVKGADIGGFIKSHHDKMDFMMCTKVPRNSKLMWGDEQVQNICRYLVTTDGAELVKVMPPLSDEPVTIHHYLNTRGRPFEAKTPKQLQNAIDRKYTYVRTETSLPKERRLSIDKGWNVTPCNNLADAEWVEIDYDYYIKEAEKLVGELK